MLSPLPRRSDWAYCVAHSPSRISLPRKGHRVGLRIVLFEACTAFTCVTACTLALSPMRDTHSEGFSYFVTSIAAPAASGWSVCRVGLAPTGKRRLVTAHTHSGLCCCDDARSTANALSRLNSRGLVVASEPQTRSAIRRRRHHAFLSTNNGHPLPTATAGDHPCPSPFCGYSR